MKKLRLGKINLAVAEVLSREQLKRVMGGSGSGPTGTAGGDNGDPCPSNCTQLCHRQDNTDFGTGPCDPSVGGSSCHNYCCDSTYTYWC